MSTKHRDKILNTLCCMSDRQVDDKIKPKIRALIGRSNEDIKDDLLSIIDECVYGALTSDFEIRVLNIIWQQCGGTDEELKNRKSPDDRDF